MEKIKAYTDLEQSKKLAEILPLESADMCWIQIYDENHMMSDHRVELIPFRFYSGIGVPCWSLAALLQVLPLGIYDEFDNCDYELEIDMIDKMPRYIRLGDIYHSKFPYDFEKDTLLDNVVESIIWLNDNNYFEL